MSLTIEGVTKDVDGNTHLYGIDLTLKKGSFNVFLGPTLAGKTSILRLLAGLDHPSSGRILMDGKDLSSIPVWKRNVSMVYQQFINYPHLSIFENIAFPLRRMRMGKQEIKDKVISASMTLGINDLLERSPGELSGGQQQRVALARSLVKGSDLLLLDEPLINLDYKLREQLRDEFNNIFAHNDESIVIYSTTDPVEALLLGGDILVLDKGRQLQSGPTHEVYRNPCSDAVARVFNDPPMNMLTGVVEGGRITLGKDIVIPKRGHLSDLSDGRYIFGLRASSLGLSRKSEKDIVFDACVDLGEINGSETFVHIHHNDVSWVVQENGVHQYSLRQMISIHFNPEYLFVFGQDGSLTMAPKSVVAINSAVG